MPRFGSKELDAHSNAVNCALSARGVSLRPVSTRSEEAAAIEAMKLAGPGRVHAPLLDEGGLPGLLTGFVLSHGLDATDGLVAGDPAPTSPGLIVVSPGVEANVVDLAAALTGSRICRLPMSPADV